MYSKNVKGAPGQTKPALTMSNYRKKTQIWKYLVQHVVSSTKPALWLESRWSDTAATEMWTWSGRSQLDRWRTSCNNMNVQRGTVLTTVRTIRRQHKISPKVNYYLLSNRLKF